MPRLSGVFCTNFSRFSRFKSAGENRILKLGHCSVAYNSSSKSTEGNWGPVMLNETFKVTEISKGLDLSIQVSCLLFWAVFCTHNVAGPTIWLPLGVEMSFKWEWYNVIYPSLRNERLWRGIFLLLSFSPCGYWQSLGSCWNLLQPPGNSFNF